MTTELKKTDKTQARRYEMSLLTKPCPFCGSTELEICFPDEDDECCRAPIGESWCYIRCLECGGSGPIESGCLEHTTLDKIEKLAVARWNRGFLTKQTQNRRYEMTKQEMLKKAFADMDTAVAKVEKASANMGKAYANRGKADADRAKAFADWEKAFVEIERIEALPDDYEE